MNPERWARSRNVLGRRAGIGEIFCGGRSECRGLQTETGEGSLCAHQTSNESIHKLSEGEKDGFNATDCCCCLL